MKKVTIDWEMYASAERADKEFDEKFRAEQLALFLKEREQKRQNALTIAEESQEHVTLAPR